MYRTPVRRGLSPDSPVLHGGSQHSREGSWSRGHSPQPRSPDRRGRSRKRSRSRSSSPNRSVSGSSSSSRHRSRSRSRSRSRNRSRPSGGTQSKPRGRAARSPLRPRRSPSPYSRRRSPGDTHRYEGRSGEQHRHSPSYRSSTSSDHRPPASSHGRSGATKSSGHDSSPRVYQSSGDSHVAPLPPMPKKSILKKRPDVVPSSHDQSPQVDQLTSIKDVRSDSSAGAEKSPEKNNLTTESPLPIASKMNLLNSSVSNSSAPAAAQKLDSPLPHGSIQVSAASTSLTTSTEIGVKESVTDKNPPCEQKDRPKVIQYNLLFKKIPPKPQGSDMNVYSEHKEIAQKGMQEAGGFLFRHEQDCKPAPLPSKTVDPKQRSSVEIEDEERFLYGDEEEKKPEAKKPPSVQKASAPPVKSSPNNQEFEKIHDLLKTIGLDIGVAEIGELAIRTQERLHGKKAIPKMSQPVPPAPQTKPSTATPTPAKTKAKVSKPQVKTEKNDKEKAEAAAKTAPPVKPTLKEPTTPVTPPVTQPSPVPVIKDEPQLLLQKSLPKETTAAPKVEDPEQPPTHSPVPHPTPPPISPTQMPVYPSYTHTPMVPTYNMPPPNYNPYSPYVSYPTSTWTMYSEMPPPTHMTPPAPLPVMSIPVGTPASMYNMHSHLRFIETTKDLSDAKPTTPLSELLAREEAERKNKETETIKVMEELDFVRKELKVKCENLKTLRAKVEQLHIQQGLLLRKKRRERDGHKDPLLEELNNVLDSAQKQISSLRDEVDATKHKRRQLTKVAEILGVNPIDLVEKSEPKKEEKSPGSPAHTRDSDNESRPSNDSSKSLNDSKTLSDPTPKIDVKSKSVSKSGTDKKSLGAAPPSNVPVKSEDVHSKDNPRTPRPNPKNSPEPRSPYLSKSEDISKTRDKSRSKSPQPSTPSSKVPVKSEEPLSFDLAQIFEYYDSGSHWCEDCNAICMTLLEYLVHLHDKNHKQCVKEVKRPWVKKKAQDPSTPKKQKVTIPLKGPEFLIPVNGYYCVLCEELFPDHIAAGEHLRAYAHNNKYKIHTEEHVTYEAVRRERKKELLTIAQKAAHRNAAQKHKIAEQRCKVAEEICDDLELSRSKKAKKEQENDRKSKATRHTSASPSTPDRERYKTPEKEPAKNPAFGKLFWKTAKNKKAAVSSSRVDTASNKPKKEEPKGISLKSKGFAIKLTGKPSSRTGNALSPSHSATSTTITTTSSASSPSPSTTTTSRAQAKVRPDLPSSMNIRPNLPSVLNIRSATPMVTMSKPAPLDTFLSIRSSNAASKSIPIVKNNFTDIFSGDLVSKAFGGEMIIKESTQLNSTDKTANKEPKKTTGQSLKALQPPKGQDLVNFLISQKETVENQEVKSDKESSVSTQQPLHSFPQKSGPVPASSHTTFSSSIKPVQTSGSLKVQQTENTKFPVPNPASSPVSSTSVKSPISASTNGASNNAKSDSAINPSNQQTSSNNAISDSAINSSNQQTSSNNAKSDSVINPSNQQTGKVGFTPSEVQKPQDAKSPSKLEKETPQEVKASTFSMNPATGRLEYLPVQQTKVKGTHVQKWSKTKLVPTIVTYVNIVKPKTPVSTPPTPVLKIKPAFNATTRLNQKFKTAPLSLPRSLFGHVQDAAYKDIKITSVESQKTKISAEKSEIPLFPPPKKEVSSSPLAKPRSVNSSTMQLELDSYYKLIASEEDPEDLTTSEDQDSEAAPPSTNVSRAPSQIQVENPPEKKAKLEIAPPPVKTPIRPVSGEDIDDSDMACEVPEVPSSSVSQISGWTFMQTSYGFNQSHWSSNCHLSSLASANGSMSKDQTKETHVTTAVSPESSMEDLSVCVTCDSD